MSTRHLPIIALVLLLSGCVRTADGSDQLTGYWRGYIQIKKGTGGFIDKPTPLYCKIEQTGNSFIGKYSHAFDADSFKNKVPETNYDLDGTVTGDKISLRLSRSGGGLVVPDRVGDLRHANNRITGTWIEYWKNFDGSIEATYEGVIELIRY